MQRRSSSRESGVNRGQGARRRRVRSASGGRLAARLACHMAQTGTALLPLHYGRVPPWLATRMASLGRVITEAIVLEYGRDEFLERLAHPYWFQALGAVMGMDWHSSGITTSVLGALKRGLAPVQWELGIHVCGGRGSESRKTPAEVTGLCERLGLDGEALVRASRLVAKVDSAAVQDGYDLYLHGFILADDGRWAVVQQGMNGERRDARRYHWLSERVMSFVDAPHAAIDGRPQPDPIVNLTDRRADAARVAQLALVGQGPGAIAQAIVQHRSAWRERAVTGPAPSELRLPFHHDVRAEDVIGRRLHGALSAAHARAPKDFAELLLTPGVGPRRSARSCTAHLRGSAIRRVFLSRMAGRMGIRIRSLAASTTKRSACSSPRSSGRSWGRPTSSPPSGV
jgi:hypothetical protein